MWLRLAGGVVNVAHVIPVAVVARTSGVVIVVVAVAVASVVDVVACGCYCRWAVSFHLYDSDSSKLGTVALDPAHKSNKGSPE